VPIQLGCSSSIEDDRDPAVVDERHLHARPENAAKHSHTRLPENVAELLVERLCELGVRRRREARPVSLPRVVFTSDGNRTVGEWNA